MSHIIWDSVPKKDSVRYYNAIAAITPVVPQAAKWRGKLLNPRPDLYQAELRWNSDGEGQALMVVGLDGWDWKTFEKAGPVPPGGGWNHPADTRGFTVRFSSNAALWFTTEHFNELPAIAEEARMVLASVYKEFA